MDEHEELKMQRSACKQSKNGSTVEVFDGEILIAKWRHGKRVYHNMNRSPEWALDGYGHAMEDTATDG